MSSTVVWQYCSISLSDRSLVLLLAHSFLFSSLFSFCSAQPAVPTSPSQLGFLGGAFAVQLLSALTAAVIASLASQPGTKLDYYSSTLLPKCLREGDAA